MTYKRIRRPAHAGTFYPATKEELVKAIEYSFMHPIGPGKLPIKEGERTDRRSIGFIVPHAGYIYSGPVAAHAYYKLSLEKPPRTIVLVGPNHNGIGIGAAVYKGDAWRTPLGDVEVDMETAKLLVEHSSFFGFDSDAHIYEHSLEVQLPFLQYIYDGEFKIVPITIYVQTLDVARDLASALAKIIEENKIDMIYIASTDFNHYEPHEISVQKDLMAINAILERDEEKLYRLLDEYNITMCGPVAAAGLIRLSKLLEGSTPRLLKHATSGDITGEKEWVVGYASIWFPQ
ncbi:MAG: AmmeMemoRadiSam system protein B [Desulfurococcales archaeon]|nr:AmmeMemoRadiSam system protein B [Desulfurococcales archaeon]